MTAPLRMLDVSSVNHGNDQPIDWRKVKRAKYDAVMIKATEGIGYVNPWLVQDAAGAHTAGLLVGFYHFARPAASGGDAQADHAIAATIGLHHDLGLACDLEISEGQSWADLAVFAQAFHGAAHKAFTHSPLYVNDYFLDNLPGAPFGERLWLAQTDRPRRMVWAWQETTAAAIAGIVGVVDVGYLHPGV